MDDECFFTCKNNVSLLSLLKLSAQKINDHIKEIREEAGIKDLVNYVDYSGGKASEHSYPGIN